MIIKITKPKFERYNIRLTAETHELLRKAKAAIAASNPKQALELLSTLKLKSLDTDIAVLSARLTDAKRIRRLAAKSAKIKTKEQNSIKNSIILLINVLKKEIAQSVEFQKKIRTALKLRYENRLSQNLSRPHPVNLRLVPSTTETTPLADHTFVQYSEAEIRKKLTEHFEASKGQLWLIGVPGAGKTTLLLQLAIEILEKETTHIPVVLNLARWRNSFPTLEAWIKEILPAEIGLAIPKKGAANLISQNRLILLLDGFDEVKEEDRLTCLEAIGAYAKYPRRYLILSSRIDEYKAVAKDAPVNRLIEVGTLTYEQLVEQLEKADQHEGAKRLLVALKEDILLREIAAVPFYFYCLQLLFASGKSLNGFNFLAIDSEGRKKEIEQRFVSEVLHKLNGKEYDAQLANRYLSFFSSRLTRENLIDFELTHLKYDWCTLSKRDFVLSNALEPLGEGLVGGFVGGLVGWLIGGVVGGLFGGLTLGLVVGQKLILYPSIKTREHIKWNWSERISRKFLVVGLVNGLVVGLAAGIPLGLTLGLVYGLSVGLAVGLVAGLKNQINKDYYSFIQINHPYQGYIASAKVLHFSILQHWHLLRVLNKKRLLPEKLVPFLDEMVECNILETTGASWRFRHRILQDYFADQWVETEFEPEQK